MIAVITVFEEEALLPGCLESLRGQVDRVAVLDGAYEQFEHEAPWSRDKTREIAWCYGAEWVGVERAWRSEVDKANAAIGQAAVGEWVLRIDADERLVGALPELVEGEHYALQVADLGERLGWGLRVVRRTAGMRYEGSHVALWEEAELELGGPGERLLRVENGVKVDPGVCRLAHLYKARAGARMAAKDRYARWLTGRELGYRLEHGL